jgi:translation initiation factor IF-3
MKAVKRFFDEGDKDQLTLRFRGRGWRIGARHAISARSAKRWRDRQGRSRAETRRRQMMMVLAPR